MNEFEQLLAELNATANEQETLAKALPAEDGKDDEAIQAAAGDEGAAEAEAKADEAGDHAEPDGDEDDEGKEPMAKSLTIEGEEVEIVDAEQLIKSLSDLSDRVGTHDQTLVKALADTTRIMKAQGDLIKSLSDRLDKVSKQGAGRKAVLAISERPAPGETTMAKSEQAPHPGEILAKALAAQQTGKITAHDVSRCEIAFQSGVAFPADVLAKI